MNASISTSSASVLLERCIYLMAKLIIKTGSKKEPLEVYREELAAVLRHPGLDTVTRLLKELAAAGDIIKLPQFKDFYSQKFGPVRLRPGGRIWARVWAKVEELKARRKRHAEKAKKGKNPSKNRPTFLQTISSLSSNKEGELMEKEKKRRRLKAQEAREIARLDREAQNSGHADKIPAPQALDQLLKTSSPQE